MIDSASKVNQQPLYGIFSGLPRCYDLINRVITWGWDKRWRLAAARECLASRPMRILDLGCGTGDLAIDLARLADNSVEVFGLDYSQPMLAVAAKKAEMVGKKSIVFVHGVAAEPPFPEDYFDCVGISFAFRNLTYKNPLAQAHLIGILRVLNSGGRCVIVETSQPEGRLIGKLFQLYLRWFVFPAGYLLSGNRQAYRYLAESASRFYTADEVREMLLQVGFRQVFFRPFVFGAIGIHVAIK